MNYWFGIALVAYLLGAAIEGVSTASQLAHSLPELKQDCQEQPSEPTSPTELWQVIAAITTVSLCGAIFWPCRLLHRSIKTSKG